MVRLAVSVPFGVKPAGAQAFRGPLPPDERMPDAFSVNLLHLHTALAQKRRQAGVAH